LWVETRQALSLRAIKSQGSESNCITTYQESASRYKQVDSDPEEKGALPLLGLFDQRRAIVIRHPEAGPMRMFLYPATMERAEPGIAECKWLLPGWAPPLF